MLVCLGGNEKKGKDFFVGMFGCLEGSLYLCGGVWRCWFSKC